MASNHLAKMLKKAAPSFEIYIESESSSHGLPHAPHPLHSPRIATGEPDRVWRLQLLSDLLHGGERMRVSTHLQIHLHIVALKLFVFNPFAYSGTMCILTHLLIQVLVYFKFICILPYSNCLLLIHLHFQVFDNSNQFSYSGFAMTCALIIDPMLDSFPN